jgi:hypothetical protein
MKSLVVQGAAVILSLLFCGALLWLMTLTQLQPERAPDDLMVRELKLTPPPPPPPRQPQRTRKSVKKMLPDLSTAKTPSKVRLETPPLELDYKMELDVEAQLVPDAFDMDMNLEAEVALQGIFGFEELDRPPTLLHNGAFRFSFPKDLLRRGVKRGQVVVLIEIDKSGRAKVLEVASASHAQLIPIAKRLVSMAQYSAVTVAGEPVVASGRWPVVLEAPKR